MVSTKRYMFGALFTTIMGIIGHYMYDLFQQNALVGLIFPVNESTWEHLKLLFFPFLFWIILSGILSTNHAVISHMDAAAIGCFSGMLAIVALFYTYSGILGFNVGFINIIVYIIGVILSFYIYYLLSISDSMNTDLSGTENLEGVLFFIIMVVMFIAFTLITPRLGIFAEP